MTLSPSAAARVAAIAAKQGKPAVLRIGTASYAELKDRAMQIARGETCEAANAPKVFFPTMESAGKVLSGKNQELLNHIRALRARLKPP